MSYRICPELRRSIILPPAINRIVASSSMRLLVTMPGYATGKRFCWHSRSTSLRCI
jgi:hypothetical protein